MVDKNIEEYYAEYLKARADIKKDNIDKKAVIYKNELDRRSVEFKKQIQEVHFSCL